MTIRLMQGDCREVLARLPEESVQMCVTSPPYWGLRDYNIEPSIWGGDTACAHAWGEERRGHNPGRSDHGTGNPSSRLGPRRDGLPNGTDQGRGKVSQGQFCQRCGAWHGCLGLEPRHDCNGAFTGTACHACFVCHIVEVFRAVRCVLRADGTLWLNLGSAYLNKQELGLPWRCALALQADGWYLRSAITLCKVNPMPESVSDRPSSATEIIFCSLRYPRHYSHASKGTPMPRLPSQQILGEGYPYPAGTGSNDHPRCPACEDSYGIQLFEQPDAAGCKQTLSRATILRYRGTRCRIILEIIEEGDQLALGEEPYAT